jgi:hypothetical protein
MHVGPSSAVGDTIMLTLAIQAICCTCCVCNKTGTLSLLPAGPFVGLHMYVIPGKWKDKPACQVASPTSWRGRVASQTLSLLRYLSVHAVLFGSVFLHGYGSNGPSSSPGTGKISLDSTSSKPVLGPTQPPNQWVPGDLSAGVKRPGREADHSPPTSTEVNFTWIYTSTLPYVCMA